MIRVSLFIIFLIGFITIGYSQYSRNFIPTEDYFIRSKRLLGNEIDTLRFEKSQGFTFEPTPLYSVTRINTNRPYGWNDFGLTPNVGFQQFLRGGAKGQWKFISLNIEPEIWWSQNQNYQGYQPEFSPSIHRDRFFFWNRGDNPEFFGEQNNLQVWWGQSALRFHFGGVLLEAGTNNLFWGPGRWNSLTFGYNSRGYPHISFKSEKGLKTFLGELGFELVSGILKDSGLSPSQFADLNSLYFKPFSGDHKYLNALNFTYSPSFLSNLTVGFNRTFQVYNDLKGNTFLDWFPVFEGFQKKNFFDDGNTIDFDNNGRDQQITLFGSYLITEANLELYFEFGRRDHAYNWREFILNPEHARAFLFGFSKSFNVDSPIGNLIQLNLEILHQQESVNRYIRYPGTKGNLSWNTHRLARGFTNFGEPLGTGIGTGANLQKIEIAFAEDWDRFGLYLERVSNHNDFYYRAFDPDVERKPWVDLSLGFIYEKRFNNLILSSQLQIIHAKNYQWQLDPTSTPEFPKGENLTSMMAQASLIYFWNRGN